MCGVCASKKVHIHSKIMFIVQKSILYCQFKSLISWPLTAHLSTRYALSLVSCAVISFLLRATKNWKFHRPHQNFPVSIREFLKIDQGFQLLTREAVPKNKSGNTGDLSGITWFSCDKSVDLSITEDGDFSIETCNWVETFATWESHLLLRWSGFLLPWRRAFWPLLFAAYPEPFWPWLFPS